jgi:heme A synthase
VTRVAGIATGNWWQEQPAWLVRLTDARIAAAQRPARAPYATTIEMADRAGMTMVVVVVIVVAVVLSLRATRGQGGRLADRK